MSQSLSDIFTHIEAKRYRAAADMLLQAGLVTERERDPAMIAAMLSTCHLPLCQNAQEPCGTIKEQVLNRMVMLRWLKRDRLTWLYTQPHHAQIPQLDIPVPH
jgi:hypothetical protein